MIFGVNFLICCETYKILLRLLNCTLFKELTLLLSRYDALQLYSACKPTQPPKTDGRWL